MASLVRQLVLAPGFDGYLAAFQFQSAELQLHPVLCNRGKTVVAYGICKDLMRRKYSIHVLFIALPIEMIRGKILWYMPWSNMAEMSHPCPLHSIDCWDYCLEIPSHSTSHSTGRVITATRCYI